MSIWTAIFGSGVTAPIEAIGGVIDELHTSREEKDAAKIVMEKLRQQPDKLQAAINAVEAQHRSIFVAGWRPAVGWVCVFALAYIWLIRTLFSDFFFTIGLGPLPKLDIGMADVMVLLAPLLGIGGYRTVEKLTGRAK